MKIESSQVVMKSLNEYKESHHIQTELRKWKDATPQGDHLSLSSDGFSKLNTAAGATLLSTELSSQSSSITALNSVPKELSDEDLFSEEDLKKIRLLEKMIERLFGRNFKFSRIGLKELREAMHHAEKSSPNMPTAQTAPSPQRSAASPERVGWGIDFKYKASHHTYEATTFSAKGNIQVEDGRQIEFNLNLHMSRETYSEFSMHYKAGDALIDPIVLRLDEMPLTMSDQSISFDLDVDGEKDALHLPVGNAGILFFDRNNNGSADDGSELFGPTSGHGYSELQALDDDKNGWIDENDAAFQSLKLWIRSPEGENKYLGLIEAGVGALFASGQSTEFDLLTPGSQLAGKLRETGFYLHENGSPGVMHEIDLKV